ncbi:MAG: ArsR/SmtB family transcription factor [Aeromicrobium sp.]
MKMTEAQLDLVFGALADRTRRAILAQLSREDTNVTGLTELFDMSQPGVSKHLKVLEQAGLISRTRQGTMRLSHLRAEPLKDATDWPADYRTYWDESYRRLDDLLTQMDD